MNNKPAPEKTLNMSIGDNKYPINFPNNGQFLDIQAMKHNLAGTQGIYSSLTTSSDSTSQYAALTIDTVATFNVLIGQKLKDDLTVKGLLELDMVSMRILIDAYTEQYLPWYNEWMQIITAPKTNDEEKKS